MPQRVIVIGASGLIGSHVVQALRSKLIVIEASRHSTPAIDMTDPASISTFFKKIGAFDHVVVTAGDASFAPLTELNEDKLMYSVRNKMLGQIHIALEARNYLPPHGSITLTSGILAKHPIAGTAGAAIASGAINSFVYAAALELDKGQRINAVSPGWIQETMEKFGMQAEHTVSVRDVAQSYLDIIECDITGQIIDI